MLKGRIPLFCQAGLALSLLLVVAPALAAEVPDQPCDAAALPQHANFAVTPEILSAHSALKRNNRFSRKYRTRLGEGLRDLPVNFSGHYVMVTWGCGSTCLDGGMVDARTGQATALPFLLDSFGSFEVDIADPLLYRADSRLVVMLGMLREEDKIPRQYFYEWTHGKLKPLCHAPITEKTR
jgi:hypothetical protein